MKNVNNLLKLLKKEMLKTDLYCDVEIIHLLNTIEIIEMKNFKDKSKWYR